MNIEMLCWIKNVLRNSMNRIQSEIQKIGTYEINKVSFSWFEGKIHVLHEGLKALALGA